MFLEEEKMEKNDGKDKYTIRTSIENHKAEFILLQCVNCNGTIKILNKTRGKCPYCGQEYNIDEADKVEIRMDGELQDYEETEGILELIWIILGIAAILAVVVAVIIRNTFFG